MKMNCGKLILAQGRETERQA